MHVAGGILQARFQDVLDQAEHIAIPDLPDDDRRESMRAPVFVRGDLDQPEPASEGLDHHLLFDGRTVLDEPQLAEHVFADASKAILAVGQPDAEALADRERNDLASHEPAELRNAREEFVASAEHPGARYVVGVAVQKRFKQARHIVRAVGVVGVHEEENVTVCRVRADANRIALSEPMVENDTRAASRSNFGGRVNRMAVDHNDLVRVRLDGLEHGREVQRLVLRANDDRNSLTHGKRYYETATGAR
jgi:hypothetical protein